MEKFILKNGEEVKMGDKLIKQGVVNTLFGKEFIIQEVIVNEKTLPELLKAGVLTPAGCAHGTDCTCKPCAVVVTVVCCCFIISISSFSV